MDEPGIVQSDELTDATIVVRGDVMMPSAIARRAQRDFVRLRYYGLSVFAVLPPLLTISDLVAVAPLPHPALQRSTVGRIRAAGFAVTRTFHWPHCTIDLGAEATESVATRLIAAFDPPEPRPEQGGFGEESHGHTH